MPGINQWGTSGNAGFAIPLASATPPLPNIQKYTLAWDPVSQLLAWVPFSIDSITGNISTPGDLNLPTGSSVNVNGKQIISDRDVTWTPSTGTPIKGGWDASNVTFPQLVGTVVALQAALTAHGLIGV